MFACIRLHPLFIQNTRSKQETPAVMYSRSTSDTLWYLNSMIYRKIIDSQNPCNNAFEIIKQYFECSKRPRPSISRCPSLDIDSCDIDSFVIDSYTNQLRSDWMDYGCLFRDSLRCFQTWGVHGVHSDMSKSQMDIKNRCYNQWDFWGTCLSYKPTYRFAAAVRFRVWKTFSRAMPPDGNRRFDPNAESWWINYQAL